DGVHGQELWRSDGTAAGTMLVKDICPGAAGSGPFAFTNVNGTLFFAANDGVTGSELYKSDGTAAGTVLVKDVFPGPFGSLAFRGEIVNVNGTAFFNPGAIYKSDGTAAGTEIVGAI